MYVCIASNNRIPGVGQYGYVTRVGASADLHRLVVFLTSKLEEIADGTRSVADIEISSRKEIAGIIVCSHASVGERMWSLFLHRPPAEGTF
jgi:hypothetical protein